MENNDLLKLLEKLNSLNINELDEEIAKMQITYEQWSKLMGDKGYWSAGFSDILLEDKEALEGKRNISFEDFKRLAKEYGEKRVETRTTSDSSDKELKSQSQLLQEKLDPENKIDYYKANIEYLESCLEDDTLDKEEYEEYLGKIKECQESIKRCEGFQNARGGIDSSIKNIAFSQTASSIKNGIGEIREGVQQLETPIRDEDSSISLDD